MGNLIIINASLETPNFLGPIDKVSELRWYYDHNLGPTPFETISAFYK